jgi:hypothetical protein
MKVKHSLLGAVLISFWFCSSVLAQTTGKISGTVVDESTGEPLIGTNVVIEGTSMVLFLS